MKSFLRLIIPEGVWLLSFCIALGVTRINQKAGGKLNDYIESMAWIWPILIMLVIHLIRIKSDNDLPWFKVRLLVSSILLAHLFFNAWAQAYIPQSPGTGMIYLLGLGLSILVAGGYSIWMMLNP